MAFFNLTRPSSNPEEAGTQLMNFREDFNRLFDDFFRNWGMTPLWMGTEFSMAFSPRVNICETEENVEITAELPGMTAKDVELTFKDNMLVIRGEKKAEHEETKGNVHRHERSHGRFERVISMPTEVESDRIDANFKDGVLTVVLPKSKTAKAAMKKIAIKV